MAVDSAVSAPHPVEAATGEAPPPQTSPEPQVLAPRIIGAATEIRDAPCNELSVPYRLKETPQQVHDEMDVASALWVGTESVVVGTAPATDLLHRRDGHAVPVLAVHGAGEASIQIANSRGVSPWRIGAGGPAGTDGFYVANRERGIVLAFTDEGVELHGLAPAPAGTRLQTVQIDPETGRLYRA